MTTEQLTPEQANKKIKKIILEAQFESEQFDEWDNKWRNVRATLEWTGKINDIRNILNEYPELKEYYSG